MEKVKVGFIGVGGMAEHHIKTLQKLERAELTAVHDINLERANQIGSAYGADVYADAEQLLDSGKVDALFICTPPFARDDIEQKAAAKGIALLSEKPVGLDLEAAKRNARAIAASGVVNSSGYCLRYLETVQKAKTYLTGKQINMVLAYRIGGLPPVAWWRQQHMSGGQMVEQSTHQVDLVRYLAGEFDQVHSIYAQRSIRDVHPEATISDYGVVSFTMRSGAVGSIVNSCGSPHFGRGEVEIYGPDFYLCIDGKSLTIRDGETKRDEQCDTDFYLEQDRAFIEAVRTGRQELVLGDYAEAVATLEATLAFNASADAHKTVSVG
ncbi:Gfo/Idh/MocA family protein [Paenibacillus flagellatus]|uniref:Gfo/Idh/MocA family oxidoreductase n=1 Tax=Paenibacillus flagellatus TaxID=2211139 RepID=A0A2V5KK84_9BACL|nr:Gfo/Idh/MocA family oxidoreductase [Paenibacillus flagellatus]PYI55200.1 gfo/Idh/MocA family oxidoreductase [Paenibacillus flagellatus]